MSLLRLTDDGWLISHQNYINKIYDSVIFGDKIQKLLFNEKLFKLNSQFLRDNQYTMSITKSQLNNCKSGTKRKRQSYLSLSENRLEQVELIHKKFEKIMSPDTKKAFFPSLKMNDNNREAREAAHKFYDDTSNGPKKFHGCNNTGHAVIKNLAGVRYLFPKYCTFFSYDMRTIVDRSDLNDQFDFILMDPPWWNKFVRRRKKKNINAGYEMMYNEELLRIPVNKLMKANGIVGIWCTNAESHSNYILDVMFPAWRMKPIATWFWVKVTESGSTICSFNHQQGKQPYEVLIFGASIDEFEARIPDNKLLVSVPSSVHSHKPPLTEIIEPYLPDDSRCLELFARYLVPRWTSWGFEVLKFQDLALYSVEDVTHN